MTQHSTIGISTAAIKDLEASGLGWEDLRARALTPAELAACGDQSGRFPDGYVIPYYDFHGELTQYYRIKLLDPLGGPKYRAIMGQPNHLYFPPGLQDLLRVRRHAFVLITEGEKKAATAVRAGFPCVGLSGVDNWRNRQISFPEDTELKAIKSRGIITAKIPSGDSNTHVLESGVVAAGFHDLTDFLVQNDMEAIIVFDSDKGGIKSQVQRAAAQLGYELRYRGLPIANIRQLVLPSMKEKVGLDDYIVRYGTKNFATLVRNVRAKRIAFPRHPNPKTYVASRLQKSRLSRKETQDVSLAILMELESGGQRLRNLATQEMFYFDEGSHTLMDVHLGNPRIMLHETPFGSYLYRQFNLGAADQRVVQWLAAQFHGEPGIKEAKTHRVLAKPEKLPETIAYQISDSHFVVVTGNKMEPYQICQNGDHGVLFEQGHVQQLSHNEIEVQLEHWLDDDRVLWQEVMSGFNFSPVVGAKVDDKEQALEEGRKLAVLLFYLSPWLLRWKGMQLPVELVIGEPGSGKSSLYELRQNIITGVPRLSNMTNDIKDWYAGITSHGGLYVLDNVHFTGSAKDYQQRLSDELCRLVTEPNPHVEMRKLYTTSDVLSLPVTTTFALTAIDQPFYTTDLIQRSAIFEVSVIATGHDANWVKSQMKRGNGRHGWIAHQLVVLHRFLANSRKWWDDSYRAGHRLAHYEQALIIMAKTLGMDHEWIPAALKRQTSAKLSETDQVLAGLLAFVKEQRESCDNIGSKRYTAKDIVEWASTSEEFHNNRVLTNSWSLGKYMRAKRGSIQKTVGLEEDGTTNNRAAYSIQP